jgi:LuxR family maltose regulon positive regulatory protein
MADLTPAEARVLRLLPTHLSTVQIAAELHRSRATVATQVTAIYQKLGATSRDEAVRRARELGLLNGGPP